MQGAIALYRAAYGGDTCGLTIRETSSLNAESVNAGGVTGCPFGA